MTVALGAVALLGWGLALVVLRRLYRWEKQLRGARVAIAYNSRVQMQPTLFEMLGWALKLDGDKRNNGQVFYTRQKLKIAILKPRVGHGKTRTRKVKENPGVRDYLRGYRKGREAPPASSKAGV